MNIVVKIPKYDEFGDKDGEVEITTCDDIHLLIKLDWREYRINGRELQKVLEVLNAA